MKRKWFVISALVGVFAVTGASAVSAAPPTWPTNGYRPTCPSAQLSSSPSGVQYNDTTVPTIASVSAPSKVVIGPTGNKEGLSFTMKATDMCSGVGVAAVFFSANGSTSGELMPQTNDDAFHGTFTWGTGALSASETPLTLTITHWLAWSRYQTFVLGFDDKLLTSTSTSLSSPAALWSGPVLTTYIVDQSVLQLSSPPTSAKKGATIKFAVQLEHWGGTAAMVTTSAPVKLMRKIGNGKWMTAASATTDSSGKATLSTKATATASYQVMYSPDLSKGLDSASSKIVKVTVK